METTTENPTYLGDAVYAYFDGYGIELRLNDHTQPCAVYLDGPQVMKTLTKWFARCRNEASASPVVESDTTHRPIVVEALAARRSYLEDQIGEWIKCAAILDRLPDKIVPNTQVVYGNLMIYHATREDVVAIMSALSAGKWTKEMHSPTTLTYKGVVDGIPVEIYDVPPPDSCVIVETQEEVPAFTRTVRKLVCK